MSFGERAGNVDAEERRAIDDDAADAERLVARLTGGRWVGFYARSLGDVELPSGELIEVKTCPVNGRWILAGENRPPGRVVLVERSQPLRVLGAVEDPAVFKFGPPPVPNPQKSWYAPRSAATWAAWLDMRGAADWPRAPELVGTPLGPPRSCPSCRGEHPVGTTCSGGAWSWVLDEEL